MGSNDLCIIQHKTNLLGHGVICTDLYYIPEKIAAKNAVNMISQVNVSTFLRYDI